MITGLAVGSMPSAASAAPDGMSQAERNDAPLQGVQHFGLTVQNMERAYQFYTEVLGGTEVFRHGDFQGDGVQNTLLADQEIEANARGVNPRTIGVPDLRSGAQRLDVRFIQFDNMVLELLQYREADQPVGSAKSFAEPLEHMSPAFPRMMHICFYVRDDVDFNKFIADLEAESARRGMTQVRAIRTIRVMTEARTGSPSFRNLPTAVSKSCAWRFSANLKNREFGREAVPPGIFRPAHERFCRNDPAADARGDSCEFRTTHFNHLAVHDNGRRSVRSIGMDQCGLPRRHGNGPHSDRSSHTASAHLDWFPAASCSFSTDARSNWAGAHSNCCKCWCSAAANSSARMT
ncbi:VOC family protein [Bradyrhizobium sp. CCBAU 25338]|uniref:VOC family protein n=1 Tax=Bradyrhizobium sp. CCBAU 25338 TaxID=1641877 RepID=UPI002304CCF6|nr:VOC family protein [Bradyrhizobium sp. CCBAU 25338]